MMQEVLERIPQIKENERTIVSTRVFHASRRMVYRAFAHPKHLVQWWWPHGFTATVLEMDLRTGGKWRIVMHGPDGTNYPNEMAFTSVVPLERVELELAGAREGSDPVPQYKTITWKDEDGGTRLTLSSQFGSCALRDENVGTYGAVQGTRDLFERLTKFLASKGVAA